MVKRRLKILSFVFFLIVYSNVFAEEEDFKKRSFYTHQIVNLFVKEMENEFGLLCIGEGGGCLMIYKKYP